MRLLHFYLITLFLIFTLYNVSGQNTGTIEGVITDRATGETIIGATVIIEGTTTGAATDLDGKFLIRTAPGTYNIRVAYISYESVVVEGVVVEAGSARRLDVALSEIATELLGVQVVARRITDSDASVISTVRAANVVISGISAQQIQRSQDTDAAAVVKRVPGVTIIDNRFIMIRGLSERYNPTLLHNLYAPSMEADIRSFSFDIIPSSLIDRILIFKSPSPDLPGDFGGGVVQVFTKSVPDRNFVNISYRSGYDNSSSMKDFLRPETGKNHWTGLRDDHNMLPSGFPGSVGSVSSDGVRLAEVGKMLRNNWVPESVNAGLNHSLSLSGAFSLKPSFMTIGNISALTYSFSRSIEDIVRRDYNNYDLENDISSIIFDFNDSKNSESIRIGLLHNWSFSFGSSNKIEFINLFNQMSRNEYTFRSGPMYEFGYFANSHAYYQMFRGIYTSQLTGNHEINGGATAIEWAAGRSLSFREEPDYRRYRSDVDDESGEVTLYIPSGAAATYFMGRFYSEMNEESTSGNLKISHTLTLGDVIRPKISAGVFHESRERSFKGRNLGYVRASMANFNQDLIYVTIDSLFHPDNINPVTGIRIDEQTNPSDSYDATFGVTAAFAMVSSVLPGGFNVTAGVRAESGNLLLNSFTLTNDPVVVDYESLKILPSVNISYSLTDRALLRLAYGKTINRPEFREIAPFGFYDFNYNLVRKGNPDLRSGEIHNVDFRWEFYPGHGEIVNAGFFYKNFVDPIELIFVPGGGTAGIKTFIPVNTSKSVSWGTEAEVRKSLNGLTGSGFLDRLTLLFNGSFVYSKLITPETSSGMFEERPMQGQSPYIINAGLYYNDHNRNLQVNMLYNVIGRRISVIGYPGYPDIYEMPRHLADISISKGFGRFIELRAGVSDIFNQPNMLLQDGNQDGIFDREKDQIIEMYSPGTTFTFGLTLKLN